MNRSSCVTRLDGRIETYEYREPFRAYLGGFSGRDGVQSSLLVEIELDDGRTGSGEATPLPGWSGETPRSALVMLEDIVRLATTARPAHCAVQASWAALAGNGYLLWAIEAAVIDSLGAGEALRPIPIRGLIGPFEPELAARVAARQAGEGYDRIKVKLSGILKEDRTRLRAVREAVPRATLIVDANEAIDYEQLPSYAALFRDAAVAGVEQPCGRLVVRERGLPKADGWCWIADESIWGIEDALALRSGPWDVWTLHPGKSRGEAALRRMAGIARDQGIATVVGSNLHFGPGVPALCRIASALPESRGQDLLGHDIPAPVVFEEWALPGIGLDAGLLHWSGTTAWEPWEPTTE